LQRKKWLTRQSSGHKKALLFRSTAFGVKPFWAWSYAIKKLKKRNNKAKHKQRKKRIRSNAIPMKKIKSSSESKETYVLNFFFGEELIRPLEFEYTFEGLKNNNNNNSKVRFQLLNSSESFPAEKQFEEFNSMNNRQNVGHNYKACVETGRLKIIYPSFDSDKSYEFTEKINNFLQYTAAYILTFFQRRRVIFGCPRLTSGDRIILSMPPFMAAELVDSVGYGEPLISYESSEECLNTAISKFAQSSDEEQERISMLVLRFNETLNLPYTYERIESYWRIMESLGGDSDLTADESTEYQRIKEFLCMRNHSKTLKKFVKALMNFDILYTDELVKNSFEYRNKTIHEYLNPSITNEPYLGDIFRFLNKSIELIILSHLGIDNEHYTEARYSLIYNRVI
jgi:hypothetical protein